MKIIEQVPFPGFDAVWKALSGTVETFGLEFILLGAGARNVWLNFAGVNLDRRSDRIYDEFWDVLTDYELNDQYEARVGSRVLGREIKEIVNDEPALRNRLKGILQGHLDQKTPAILIKNLCQKWDLKEGMVKGILQECLRGFNESPEIN